MLRARCSGVNHVDVYCDVTKYAFVHGVAPGTLVCLRRLARKVSRSANIYCSFTSCSELQLDSGLETLCGSDVPSLPEQLRHLSSFVDQSALDCTVARVTCSVRSVLEVTMEWLCTKCGQCVCSHTCPLHCVDATHQFRAQANCLVDDGTAEVSSLTLGFSPEAARRCCGSL